MDNDVWLTELEVPEFSLGHPLWPAFVEAAMRLAREEAGFQGNTGQTVPVKFGVQTAAGAFVSDRSVLIDVLDSAGRQVVEPVGYSRSPADSVAIQNDQYHLDLRTDGLAPGSYTIRARFNSPALVGTSSFPMSLV